MPLDNSGNGACSEDNHCWQLVSQEKHPVFFFTEGVKELTTDEQFRHQQTQYDQFVLLGQAGVTSDGNLNNGAAVGATGRRSTGKRQWKGFAREEKKAPLHQPYRPGPANL